MAKPKIAPNDRIAQTELTLLAVTATHTHDDFLEAVAASPMVARAYHAKLAAELAYLTAAERVHGREAGRVISFPGGDVEIAGGE